MAVLDVAKTIRTLPHFMRKKTDVSKTAIDGPIFKLHYVITFSILIAGFSMTWFSWFNKDEISCVNQYNINESIKRDHLNICYSYPYVETENGRKPILWYKWIHFVLLIFASLYYLIRKYLKFVEDPELLKLVNDISDASLTFSQRNESIYSKVAQYLSYNWNTFNNFYQKYVLGVFLCLIVNITVFFGLDYILDYKFIGLIPSSFPFSRDYDHFSDNISKTFPQYVNCTLSATESLVNLRTEQYGCHLTNMEYYDKYFVFLWFIIVINIFSSIITFVFYASFSIPFVKRLVLRVLFSEMPILRKVEIMSFLEASKFSNVFILFQLSKHFSTNQFYNLLLKLIIEINRENDLFAVICNKDKCISQSKLKKVSG